MVIYTTCTQNGDGTLTPVAARFYPGGTYTRLAGWDWTATTRYAYQVDNPDPGLDVDLRFPVCQGDDPGTFEAYRNALLAALAARAQTISGTGFAFTGTDALDGTAPRAFTFQLSTALDVNITQITVGLSSGIMTYPQSIGPDRDGHALLIPDQTTWVAFLTAYKTCRIQIDGGPGTGGGGELRAKIAAAQSAPDLDAVVLA